MLEFRIRILDIGLSYPSYSAKYKVEATNGNLYTCTESRVLAQHEPHPYDNSKTVQEIQEKLDNDEYPEDESYRINYSPLKNIEDIADAQSSAARMIKSELVEHNIKKYDQPKYLVTDKRDYNQSDFNTLKRAGSLLKDLKNIEHRKVDSNPEENDSITIQNTKDFRLEFPRLKVMSKNNELGVSLKNTILEDEFKFLKLSELKENDYEVTEVYRAFKIDESKYDSYKPKVSEMKLGFSPRKGTTASIYEARENIKRVYDYMDARVKNGDPLFDQYLYDTYKESKAAIEHIEKLIDALEVGNERA